MLSITLFSVKTVVEKKENQRDLPFVTMVLKALCVRAGI